jgi:hypothetical protein
LTERKDARRAGLEVWAMVPQRGSEVILRGLISVGVSDAMHIWQRQHMLEFFVL